ncbi:MAG TPA: extracellular solute-binding protein [Patescibacteria group bacterium]|nr:extracellular solute-binding protein [Patescibacteria group bacterium]
MKATKYIVFLSVLLVIFGSGLSCGKKTTTTTPDNGTTLVENTDTGATNSLVIWGVFDSSDTWQPIIKSFNKQKGYTDTKITYVMKDYADYESMLIDAIASDNGPDIFYVSNSWIGKHKAKMVPAKDTIISVDDYQKKFFPAAYEDFVLDKNIYAFPLYSDSLALFYNSRMFNKASIVEAPATWDDVIKDAEILTHPIVNYDKKGRVTSTVTQQADAGIAMGLTSNISRSQDIVLALMLQTGTIMNSEDKRTFTFNQFQKQSGTEEIKHPGASALDFYTAFANGNENNKWSSDFPSNIEAFANSKVAMMIGYSYMIPQIKKINPDISLKVAPFPQITGAPSNITLANYWGWAVSRNSKNQGLAWSFMKFVSDPANITQYLTATKKPSPLISISGGSDKVFETQKEYAKTFYKGNGEAFDKIIIDMIDSVTKYGESSQSALDTAVSRGNDMLKKYY